MDSMKMYYEAYDDRYRQVHEEALQWFSSAPTPIVAEVIARSGIRREDAVLELGCGEGRDAGFLLEAGYRVLGTDISPEAVRFCREKFPRFADRFQVLDCVGGSVEERFAFIYAVAVVHMLVRQEDRNGFYRFIREHLTDRGIALICTMGDGEMERSSDIDTAFELQRRSHMQTGRSLLIAGTSCRVVGFDTFCRELGENGLEILEEGITGAEPDFPVMMYAVVRRRSGTV